MQQALRRGWKVQTLEADTTVEPNHSSQDLSSVFSGVWCVDLTGSFGFNEHEVRRETREFSEMGVRHEDTRHSSVGTYSLTLISAVTCAACSVMWWILFFDSCCQSNSVDLSCSHYRWLALMPLLELCWALVTGIWARRRSSMVAIGSRSCGVHV